MYRAIFYLLLKALVAVSALAAAAGCAPPRLAVPPEGARVTRLRWTQSYQLVRIREGSYLAVHLPHPGEDEPQWRLVRRPDRRTLRFRGMQHAGEDTTQGRHADDVIFIFEGIAPGLEWVVIETEEPSGLSAARFEVAVEVYY